VKKIYVGCQGWNYKDWISPSESEVRFYPPGVKTAQMLEFYAKVFECVEVDSTFYAIPSQKVVEGWKAKTPPEFKFTLKMPRDITHEKMLDKSALPVLKEFCDIASILGEKLFAVLIQLPPQFEANKQNALNLRYFLNHLPRPMRFAVEFRNQKWLIDWTFEELRRHNVAFCLVEGSWIPHQVMFQVAEKTQADFAYLRFMGKRDLVHFDKVVRPQDANLVVWKDKIEKLKAKEIFITFSNFYEGFAPESANKMRHLLGQEPVEIAFDQRTLFE
jgi:uncharacterized protein YecE (DUF72 family)